MRKGILALAWLAEGGLERYERLVRSYDACEIQSRFEHEERERYLESELRTAKARIRELSGTGRMADSTEQPNVDEPDC